MSLISPTAHLNKAFDLPTTFNNYLSRPCIGGELEDRKASAGTM